MVDQKEKLLKDRRAMAAQVRLQKENIAKTMDELRTNAAKANKIIEKAMNSSVPLTELLGSTTLSPTKKQKGTKSSKSLASSSRGSKSADNPFFANSMSAPNTAGSMRSFSLEDDAEPKPYQSPYVPSNGNFQS